MEAPRSEGLPSPRSVSTATISSQSRENEKYTLMLMQWGQFVDHDITHTPTVKGEEESGILCCRVRQLTTLYTLNFTLFAGRA